MVEVEEEGEEEEVKERMLERDTLIYSWVQKKEEKAGWVRKLKKNPKFKPRTIFLLFNEEAMLMIQYI